MWVVFRVFYTRGCGCFACVFGRVYLGVRIHFYVCACVYQTIGVRVGLCVCHVHNINEEDLRLALTYFDCFML